MFNWSQFPFVRIVIPFIIGIYMADRVDHVFPGMNVFLVLLLFLYLLFVLFLVPRLSYHKRWLIGPFINLFLFSAGYFLMQDKISSIRIKDCASPEPKSICIQLMDDPVERANSYRVEAIQFTGEAYDSLNDVQNCRLILYFQKEAEAGELQYGDVLWIHTKLEKIINPGNPNEFDLSEYLFFKGIIHRGFIKSGCWKKLDHRAPNRFLAWSKRLRLKLLGILKESGMGNREYGVASAILLGYDDFLESDQRKLFADAGAMHILCVSGLHVGIIAMVLGRLLLFLKRSPTGRLVRLVLLIASIWMYATITGLSPSVLRAATMFSFIHVGTTFKRQVSIYNMLAASAFLLLLINPFMLMAVGFQLSYIAVCGIVLLYQTIYNLFVPANVFLDKLWQITAVSIAATLATMPLSLYYFHQFPNYFILTNLVAIPGSFLIVLLGTLMLSFSFIPILLDSLGFVLRWVITLLNEAISFIGGLPGAVWENIYLSLPELVLLFFLIFFFSSFFILGYRRMLFIGLIVATLLSLSIAKRKLNGLNQVQLVIYNIHSHHAIGFFHGKELVLLADSVLISHPEKMRYAMRGHQIFKGIRKSHIFKSDTSDLDLGWLKKSGCFIGFAGLKIVIPQGEELFASGSKAIDCDLFIVTGNARFSPEQVNGCFMPKKIILSPSVKPWERKKWIVPEEGLSVDIHDIVKQGAYLISPD